ncbi:MAG: four helix bundle protein [Clostridia bacterium]
MTNKNPELILIPKYEKYMQYMIEVIIKMPRTEKFNIGNEFKIVMYKSLENILYINKVEISKRLYYLNLIDAELGTQRVMLRIMQKNKWMDEKKFRVSMEMLYEIGKILGDLIKQYAKNKKNHIIQ